MARKHSLLTCKSVHSSSLREEDRVAVRQAGTKASTHATIGSLVGVALGTLLAVRLRSNRAALYRAFRAADKPTHVRFADGREQAIPDITPLLQPTPLGDAVTYMFFGIAGLFLGGETGLLTGTWAARRTIAEDPDRKKRIEAAYRAFRADVLRKQIEELESGREEPIWS